MWFINKKLTIYNSALVLKLLFVFFLSLSCGSCISHQKLNKDSQSQNNLTPPVLFILMDGFGLETYSHLIKKNELKNLNNFFSSAQKNSSIQKGMAQFPSLTYPNLVSVLTQKPISEHFVSQNKLFVDWDDVGSLRRKPVNLESPLDLKKLNRQLESQLIFSKLKKSGERSVSFAHSIYEGSDVGHKIDFETGVYYLTNETHLVDENILDATLDFLKTTPYDRMPQFIFVHLTGYDFLAHENGHLHPKALKYLVDLDQKMLPLWKQLEKMQSQNQRVMTLLTADHGFMTPRLNVPIEENIKKANIPQFSDLVLLNDGRVVSAFFKNGSTKEELNQRAQLMLSQNGVGLVAYRHLNQLVVLNKETRLEIKYRSRFCPNSSSSYQISLLRSGQPETSWYCPEEMDQLFVFKNYPRFFTHITRYFESSGHGDLLLLAEDEVCFLGHEKGGVHGGMTTQELMVPIFIRNGILREPKYPVLSPYGQSLSWSVSELQNIIFNYELLKFLEPNMNQVSTPHLGSPLIGTEVNQVPMKIIE